MNINGYKWGDDCEPREGSVKPELLKNWTTEDGNKSYTCPKCHRGMFEKKPHIVACQNDRGEDRCGVWFDWRGIDE